MGKGLAVCLVAAMAMAGAIALSARSRGAREIVVVAREMSFYLDGEGDANPTLHLRAGEEVRVVFRNEDSGIKHDFTIPDWGIASQRVAGKGQTAVTFRAPDTPTTRTYQCTPHSTMMRGTIAVE